MEEKANFLEWAKKRHKQHDINKIVLLLKEKGIKVGEDGSINGQGMNYDAAVERRLVEDVASRFGAPRVTSNKEYKPFVRKLGSLGISTLRQRISKTS